MKKRENLRCIGLKIHQIVISGFGVLLALFIIISLIVIMDTNTANANTLIDVSTQINIEGVNAQYIEGSEEYIKTKSELGFDYVVDNGLELFYPCHYVGDFNNYRLNTTFCEYKNITGSITILHTNHVDEFLYESGVNIYKIETSTLQERVEMFNILRKESRIVKNNLWNTIYAFFYNNNTLI